MIVSNDRMYMKEHLNLSAKNLIFRESNVLFGFEWPISFEPSEF